MKLFALGSVLFLFTVGCFASESQTKPKTQTIKNSRRFSTTRDFSSTGRSSQIKVKNTGASSKTVYGLYIRQFSYVPTGNSCASPSSIYSSSQNTSAGAVVMPVTIEANGEAEIGANYLYNMIYTAQYYVRILIPSSPPGCALPGCTWGSDTNVYDWCIYLGAIGPVSASGGYTSNVVPSVETVSGGGFNYNLVSTFETIGPISCDDQNLTCTLATSQTQTF